jgi:EmrB/QacA subfamily drug resistance transporter
MPEDPGATELGPAQGERTAARPACEGGQAWRRPWALAVVCSAALVVNVDNTILNVALPTLGRELHAGSSELQWIVDAYAMVFAGLLLVGGSLADRLGRRRLFLLGLSVFAAGSVGAAYSGSVGWLIGSRAVMGMGAALTIPASLSIVNDVYRAPTARARAIGVWAGVIGLGTAIGPMAGGLLLAHYWWGAIFLVNVPIVLTAGLSAPWLVPESTRPAAGSADPLGAVLSISGLALLLWAIIEAPARGWLAPSVIAAAAGGSAVLTAFAGWEARCHDPMLKMRLLLDRRFYVPAGAEALGTFGLLGALFVQTQFLQLDLGYSPLEAGLRLVPLAMALVLTAALAPGAARRAGARFTAAGGLATIAGGLWLISWRSYPGTTYADVLPGMLLIGFGAGLLLPTATDSVVGSVPRADSGVGSAMNAVALQVGGAFGVAVIGSVMSTRYQDHLVAALTGLTVSPGSEATALGSLSGALTMSDRAGGATGALLADAARAAFMSGSGLAMGVGAATALSGGLLMLAGLRRRGATVSGSSQDPRARMEA